MGRIKTSLSYQSEDWDYRGGELNRLETGGSLAILAPSQEEASKNGRQKLKKPVCETIEGEGKG